MKNFTNDEIEARISTKIPEHSDKNPIPQGDDPNHYLQAEELNIIVKFWDENTAIVKELMKNSNELGFSVENYIQLYNSDEEFQIFYDEGLSSKIYFNPATEVIRIGLLDSDGFKEYNFSEIHKIPQLKSALDNEIVERARVDALKLNKPTQNATNQYVLLADGTTSPKSNFGKVDTIDGIEADETKDVKLGAVRKTESNEVTSDFDFHQENGAYVSVATDGVKVSKGGIYSLYKPDSIKPVNQVPSVAYQFQELLFPKRAVIGVEEKVYPITYIQGVKASDTGRVDISGVAMNWTNAQQRMSALVSKHNDATYNRLLGMDAQGNINEVGLPAMTNEILKSSDAQKDSWRLASLKTNETFTNGKPVISLFAKTYIDKTLPYKQNFSLLGSNLYVNPSLSTLKMIQIKDESGNIITPIEHVISDFSVYYSQTSVLSFFYDFSVLPKGSYAFRLTNQLGLTSDLSREFTITETSVQNPVNITWDYIGEVGKESTDYLVTTTSVTITNLPIWGGGVEANKRNCAYKTDTFITEELVLSGFILEFNGTTTGNYFGGSLPSIVEITRLDDVVLFGLQFSKTGGTPNITSILPTNSEIYTGIPTMNISMTQKINIIYKDGVVEIIGLGDNGVYFYSRVYLIDFPISNLRLKVRLGGSEQSNTQVLSKGIVFTNLSKL